MLVSLRRSLPLLSMSSRVTRSAKAHTNGAPPPPKPKQGGKTTKSKASGTKRDADAELEESLRGISTSTMPPPPTPPPKRQRKSPKEVPEAPSTPTPTGAKIHHQTASPLAKGNTAQKIPLDRPADPNVTNAPIATPRGSRHTAYNDGPPPEYFPRPRTDTTHLLKQACEHLIKVDPRIKPVIDAHPCPIFTPEALAEPINPFNSLVSGICGQQVSGAAAASIRRKFIALFNEDIENASQHKFPTPHQVIQKDVPTLRTAGLSQRKSEYVSGLAEKFVSGELSAEMLTKASWEEVLEKLTAVRGLGVWSVEMFGCFALKRMDIFATGDLGIQYVHPLPASSWANISQTRVGGVGGKGCQKAQSKGRQVEVYVRGGHAQPCREVCALSKRLDVLSVENGCCG